MAFPLLTLSCYLSTKSVIHHWNLQLLPQHAHYQGEQNPDTLNHVHTDYG
nr:MAG TPA: hypothetical protein [Herelleviridae sp.]